MLRRLTMPPDKLRGPMPRNCESLKVSQLIIVERDDPFRRYKPRVVLCFALMCHETRHATRQRVSASPLS
jgi:hypothetical protein